MPDLTLWTRLHLGQFKRDMELLFDSLRRDMGMPRAGGAGPRISVEETEDSVVILAETPGYGIENLSVSLEEDVLTLRGERREEAPNGEGDAVTRAHSFSQSLRLPCVVEADRADAVFKDGQLRIILPRRPPRGPRNVCVKAG